MLSNKLDAFNKTILWKLYNLTNSVFFCGFSRILLTHKKTDNPCFMGIVRRIWPGRSIRSIFVLWLAQPGDNQYGRCPEQLIQQQGHGGKLYEPGIED